MNHSTPQIVALVVGLVAAMGLLSFALRRFGGYAPTWRVRCTKCGSTGAAGLAGLLRIGAFSRGKFTLGFCRRCKSIRLLSVERITA